MRVREDVGLSYDDVLLLPKLGVLRKRADADISAEVVKGARIGVPIISAPMDSVTEWEMAAAMTQCGGFSFIHRNLTPKEQKEQFLKSTLGKEQYIGFAGVSIGIDEGYERWNLLREAGCEIFVLDVAHGHHKSVGEFIEKTPVDLFESSSLIVGNIATAEAAHYFADLGVAGVKVGVGPGAACSTRAVTGHGVPMLTAINDVYWAIFDYGITLIADGGIKTSGDIVKALAAGADTVMIGRLLAGADESPHPGLYWGMASQRVNGHRAPEGVEGVVDRTGPVENTIKPLAWGIRSGLSYAGVTNLQDLRDIAEFIRVTPQSTLESGVRI